MFSTKCLCNDNNGYFTKLTVLVSEQAAEEILARLGADDSSSDEEQSSLVFSRSREAVLADLVDDVKR